MCCNVLQWSQNLSLVPGKTLHSLEFINQYCTCCKISPQAAVEYFKMCMPQLEHEESAANPQIWRNVKVKHLFDCCFNTAFHFMRFLRYALVKLRSVSLLLISSRFWDLLGAIWGLVGSRSMPIFIWQISHVSAFRQNLNQHYSSHGCAIFRKVLRCSEGFTAGNWETCGITQQNSEPGIPTNGGRLDGHRSQSILSVVPQYRWTFFPPSTVALKVVLFYIVLFSVARISIFITIFHVIYIFLYLIFSGGRVEEY